MIPPASPPTSSRQILQLYCPDSRAAGAQTTKGRQRRRGWGVGVGGWRAGGACAKENGQSEDKKGRNIVPHRHHKHPGLTPTPSPDPCLQPRPPLCSVHPPPHHTWLESQLRAVPPGTTRPSGVCVCVCVAGGAVWAWQGGHVAGAARFFFLKQ